MRHLSRIAWSRNGLVAFIDGAQKVYVTWLRCTDGVSWDWVSPVTVPYPADSRPTMLCWASANSDLAIADELGRVQIVSISTDGAPKTHIVASAVRDDRKTAVELDRIIGMFWLQPEKNLIIPRSSAPHNEQILNGKNTVKPWESVPSLGPSHPIKAGGALLAINGNGMLRMLVQTPQTRYVEFDALIPNAHCVSHASFLPMGNGRLLTVLINEDENTLMAYEIVIKWDDVATWSTKSDFASLKIHPVASAALPQASLMPIDLGIFRSIGPTSKIEAWVIYPHQLQKFCISSSQEPLHESFFELFSTSNPVPPEPLNVWQIADIGDEIFDTEIMDLIIQRFQVVLVHTDGTLTTKNLLENNEVLQLGLAGLEFDPQELRDASVICLSPTGSCAALFRDTDSTESKEKNYLPILRSIRLNFSLSNKTQVAKVAISLATYYSCVVFNSDQYDDLLKVSREVLDQDSVLGEFKSTFFDVATRETQRLLSVSLGPLDDPHKVERLLVIPSPLQRWLAFLISLGTNQGWKRTPSCYAAWSLLHLQLLAFSITWTMKRLAQRPKLEISEASRGEIHAAKFHIDAILGPMQWASDLIVRISQELFDACLSDSPADLLVKEPNVFAVLVVSSVPRYLLRLFLRGVRSLMGAAKNLAEQEARINALLSKQASETQDNTLARELRMKLSSPSNSNASYTLKKILVQLQSMPIKFDAFERLLSEIDTNMKELANSNQWDNSARSVMDSELIRHAKLPDAFAKNIVPQLISSIQRNVLPGADVPVLYFYDTTWLGLDEAAFPYLVDGLRKRVILPSEDTQKCTRCGLVSVRFTDLPKGTAQWLQIFHKQCACGGSWIFEDASSKTKSVS